MAAALQYSFKGKKVLVTGGGQGIGREVISRLHADGAKIFTIEIDPGRCDKLKKDFPGIDARLGDICKWDETRATIESFGPLDHLVNNAGCGVFKDLFDITEVDVDKILGINVKAMFGISQAVAKQMIAGGVKGSIVNISSIGGHISPDKNAIYSSTKAAVLMLTKSLARELGPHGIRCNSVSPAKVDTPFLQMFLETGFKEASSDFTIRQPLAGSTVMSPAIVANAIFYLLSPLSAHATGIDILLDAGVLTC